MTSYLLSIDQGTSSCRAVIFNDRGGVEVIFQRGFSLIYPQTGWVEQNPSDILEGTIWAIQECAKYCREKGLKIAAAGLTNQRETTILWDRKTGQPVYNAIVWQDRRTASLCADLRGTGIEEQVRRNTGLMLDPYFSVTKIRWILDNVEGARERAACGEICFGTVDSFLIWHLTNGQNHATDVTNASRTMLYNIAKNEWDRKFIDLSDINGNIIPRAQGCVSDFGQIKTEFFDQNIRILGVAGDQHAALIGQGCITSGMIKITYGTGCFALMNIGDDLRLSQNRLLTTIGYHVDKNPIYALEGSIFNAGTAIQFLRDNLGLIETAAQTHDIAESLSGTEGVYFVPAFTGLGAPYWDPDARGVICGLDRHTSKAHIIRAALEAQGYQTRDLIAAMEADAGQAIKTIRADGGLAANEFMGQFLADITQRPVEIPSVTEATAWGAACLAGIGAGVFQNLGETAALWRLGRRYEPKRPAAEMDALYAGWQRAVNKTYT